LPQPPQSMEVNPAPLAGEAARSFAAMYREEFPRVVHALRRFGVPERDLEDLTHEVFFAGWRSTTYDPSRPLRPWLLGIAFRVASDFLSKARYGREQPDEDAGQATVDPSRSPHEIAEAAQGHDLVIRALQELDMDRRAVFVLAELEELPVAQAAAVLGIPEGTAWTRLRAARTRFTETVRALVQGGAS